MPMGRTEDSVVGQVRFSRRTISSNPDGNIVYSGLTEKEKAKLKGPFAEVVYGINDISGKVSEYREGLPDSEQLAAGKVTEIIGDIGIGLLSQVHISGISSLADLEYPFSLTAMANAYKTPRLALMPVDIRNILWNWFAGKNLTKRQEGECNISIFDCPLSDTLFYREIVEGEYLRVSLVGCNKEHR